MTVAIIAVLGIIFSLIVLFWKKKIINAWKNRRKQEHREEQENT